MRNEDIGKDNGTATIEPSDPVTARQQGSWTIEYTVGKRSIEPGGSIRVEIPYGFTAPQLEYPFDPGYVTAQCSRPGTKLKLSLRVPVQLDPEPFYYVTRWGRHVFIQVLDEALERGDTITMTYGWSAQSPDGAVAPPFTGEMEFTIATDCDGTRSAKFSGYTLIRQSPTLEVIGGPRTRLTVYAPSIVGVRENVRLRIVPEDEDRNTAPAELDPDDVTVDPPGSLLPLDVRFKAAGAGVVGEVPADEVGKIMFFASARNPVTLGQSNPTVVTAEKPPLRLYWGDLHVHTKLSDGLGTPDSAYEFAFLDAGLDFAAVADHGQYMSDQDWEIIQKSNKRFNMPGEFVTFNAYEYSHNWGKRSFGDKCLYYPGDEGPLLRVTDIMRSRYIDPNDFTAQWKEHGAMMILHQHAGGIRRYYDPDLVRLVEVYSVWGASERMHDPHPLLPSHVRDYTGEMVIDALEANFVLGIVAASDCHAGHPGKTNWLRTREAYQGGVAAVWAPELTREALWEALWNRRCYGTTGARIYLTFEVDGYPMGTVIEGSDRSEHAIEVEVIGTRDIEAVFVYRGDEMIRRETTIGLTAHLAFVDKPETPGPHYYYVRVQQADGEMAWSSPIWTAPPPEAQVDGGPAEG